MGLDTTPGCWHGSYSSFATWRNQLAWYSDWAGNNDSTLSSDPDWHSVSYVIPEDRGPDQGPLPDEEYEVDGETYTIHWADHYPNSVYLGHWDKDPEDVLDVLFIHSDCEGKIPHRFCYPL